MYILHRYMLNIYIYVLYISIIYKYIYIYIYITFDDLRSNESYWQHELNRLNAEWIK